METKFNINRKPITDEEINSHKNFDELVNKFKKQSIEKARSDVNFLKNKKATYSAIIAGVAVICTVTYFAVFKKEPPKEIANDKIITKQNQQNNSTETKLNKAFIAPPISKLNIPYTSYKVKTEQGATIKHKSNSKIIIPKKAFVNKQGEDIIGEVEIKYREFHNQADIISSGIPMTYDSAGVQSHFESAGMLDIRGYQNGEPVFINPKKTITIEFASEYKEDKYNMYELDTIARNWTYLERDNSLKNKSKTINRQSSKDISIAEADFDENKKSEKLIYLQKQIDAIPPKIEAEKNYYSKKINQLPKNSEPKKPTKANSDRPQFELEVDYKEFPELSVFKNALFEVGTENKNFNANLADITWSSAEISEGPIKGKNYLLTLKLRERLEKLIVYPVLSEANYDNALNLYEKKFLEYKKLLEKRETEEKQLQEEFEKKQAVYIAEQKKLNEEFIKEKIRWQKEQQAQLNASIQNGTYQGIVERVFNISNFGTFNADCPNSLPSGANIDPIYVDNKKQIIPSTIYLVCHNKNLVYCFNNRKLQFNPKDVYSLCIISNGKMYLCNKETFLSIVKSKEKLIPLSELNEDINNASDLKKALGI